VLQVKNSSIYFTTSIITALLSFITLPIYTKFLNPTDYGIITLFLLFANVSSGFLSIGLHKATFRYYFKYKSDLNYFKKINSSNIIYLLMIYLLSAIIIYFTSNLISEKMFNKIISPELIQLSFFSGFFQYFFIYFSNLLNAEEKAIKFAFFSLLKPFLDIIITMYLIFYSSLSYLAKIYGHFFSQMITVLILLILYSKLIEIKFYPKVFKSSLKFSLPQIPQNILGFAHQSFDKLLLTNYSTLSSLTHYSFGANFAMPIKMIMDAFSRSWNPSFLLNAEKNNANFDDIESPFYYMISLIFFFGLALSFFSEELVILLTEESFHFSKYIVPGYIFYYLLGSIAYLSLSQIMYAEKMSYTIPIAVVNVLSNVSLNILLIPIYGSIGAVISLFTSALVVGVTQFYFGQKSMYLRINKIKLVTFLIIYCVFLIVLYALLLNEISFIFKIILKLTSIFIYLYLLIALKYLDPKINFFQRAK
jgi:O-antigen/teichoic acid export membrane protein